MDTELLTSTIVPAAETSAALNEQSTSSAAPQEQAASTAAPTSESSSSAAPKSTAAKRRDMFVVIEGTADSAGISKLLSSLMDGHVMDDTDDDDKKEEPRTKRVPDETQEKKEPTAAELAAEQAQAALYDAMSNAFQRAVDVRTEELMVEMGSDGFRDLLVLGPDHGRLAYADIAEVATIENRSLADLNKQAIEQAAALLNTLEHVMVHQQTFETMCRRIAIGDTASGDRIAAMRRRVQCLSTLEKQQALTLRLARLAAKKPKADGCEHAVLSAFGTMHASRKLSRTLLTKKATTAAAEK